MSKGDRFSAPPRPDCIRARGNPDASGYGRVKVWSPTSGHRSLLAHRVAYARSQWVTIDSLKGKMVLHSCDHRMCINPAHLRIGTNADNVRDMVERGRQARGERGPGAKLTEAQAKEVIAEHRPWSRTRGLKYFAEKFGVSIACINEIVNGKTWMHLERHK